MSKVERMVGLKPRGHTLRHQNETKADKGPGFLSCRLVTSIDIFRGRLTLAAFPHIIGRNLPGGRVGENKNCEKLADRKGTSTQWPFTLQEQTWLMEEAMWA